MKEKNLSFRQLAQRVGISVSVLNNWAGGASPQDFAAVKRLAEALDVSFSFLLTGEQDDRASGGTVTEAFDEGAVVFDGFAKVMITRLIPRGRIPTRE